MPEVSLNLLEIIPEHASVNIECICSEFTISKKKWICFCICMPPVSNYLTIFLEKQAFFLSKAVLKFENIVLMGSFSRFREIKRAL